MSNEDNDDFSSHSSEARARRSPGVRSSRETRNKIRDETKDRAAEFPTLAKHRESRMHLRKGSLDTASNKMTSSGAPDIVKQWPPGQSSDHGARSRVNASSDLPRSPRKASGSGPSDTSATSLVGGGDTDYSTHSVSSSASVSERRRSILSQSSQVPPAFRNLDRSKSPRARKSPVVVDMDTNGATRSPGQFSTSISHDSKSQRSDPEKSSRPRRSKRPPIVASNPTISIESTSNTGSSHSREPKNPNSPRTERRVHMRAQTASDQAESTGLMVNLIDSSIVNGDESNVSTYNAILESVANSDSPDAQKGLDILATMSQHGVAPNDRTWALINMCSKVSDGNSEGDDDEHDNIIDSGRHMERTATKNHEGEISEDRQLQKIRTLSLYGHVGPDARSDPGNPPRRPWRMEQDLSLLPPAFRSSILAMLRRKSQKDNNDPATLPPKSPRSVARRNTHPTIVPNSPAPTDPSQQNIFPSVADRKKRFMSFSVNDDMQSSKITVDSVPMANESVTSDSTFSRIFAQHGVVKYMRPDGLGNAATRKEGGDDSVSQDNETDSFAEAFEQIQDSSDISTYVALLATIANSDVPDKANRAGKVLKKMKNNGIAVDDQTRALLQACAEIKEKPKEAKPHELEYVEESDKELPPTEENPTTANPIVIKRVRFAEKDSFRFIRRRRSIGSNERWDDPLTPPKRITPPVDLAPSRFASGLRDDRPAPPRRSNSLSSLMSASSHSARSDDSSDSGDSIFDDEQLTADRFKLPFTDSPEGAERKFTPRQSSKQSKPKQASKSPKQRHASAPELNPPVIKASSSSRGMPSLPVRRGSSIQGGSVSPVENQVMLSPVVEEVQSPNPLVPAPPVDDSILYTTPPSTRKPLRRRRSISGIERRSDFPLTPPRRVSAPLDIFIAQEALKSKLASEARQKAQSAEATLPKADEAIEKPKTPVNNMVESTPTLPLDEAISASSMHDSSTHLSASTSESIPGSNQPKTKIPKRSAGSMSALEVPATTQQSRAMETKSRASMAGPGPKQPSSLEKHGEKVREHWKLLKFRDKIQGKGSLDDSSNLGDSMTGVDFDEESSLPIPTADGQKGVHTTNERPRKSRGEKHYSPTKKSSSTNALKDTPGHEPWQRVVQKN